jgi:hypothetical protein
LAKKALSSWKKIHQRKALSSWAKKFALDWQKNNPQIQTKIDKTRQG